MSEARQGRELIQATKAFQPENPLRSWFHVVETFSAIAALIALSALVSTWWLRLPIALLQGLVIVRAFILYHDYMHNAILRRSTLAKWIMNAFGVLVLTPPRVWRQTHNYHHAHNAKLVGSHIGSYPMATVEMWEAMSLGQRLMYRLIRHPLNIFFGYFTVFLYQMCFSSFTRNPRRNWDSALAIALNVALTVGLWWAFGFATFFYVYFLPLFVATGAGAYLFYAQHNFPEMHVQPRSEWEYTRAALESSSYLETGPVMRWLTGNIGFHHVHHLNPGIPFYRLPEAMANIPELQHPKRTTLNARDVFACFQQKLWDPDREEMVGYPRAKRRGFGRRKLTA